MELTDATVKSECYRKQKQIRQRSQTDRQAGRQAGRKAGWKEDVACGVTNGTVS